MAATAALVIHVLILNCLLKHATLAVRSDVNLEQTSVVRRTWTQPTDANIGPAIKIKKTKPLSYSGAIDAKNRKGLPVASFSTARVGRGFTLTFDLVPGTYNVFLGFAELTQAFCKQGGRVFNVYLNEKILLESFDVFTTAKGCYKATTQRFLSVIIDPVMKKPIALRFEAIAGQAILNHVRVRRSKKQCKPITDSPNVRSNHLAHAVPGEYPPPPKTSYVDSSGQGFVRVKIDGSGSHTHFFAGSVAGTIKSYLWTITQTQKLISKKESFDFNFPLGTTRIRLAVVDTICSSDEAEASITVTGKMQPGQYCYYYKGLTELPLPGTLSDAPAPSFAAIASATDLKFPSFPFRNTKFAARCVFFVQFASATTDTVVSVSAGKSGKVRVYKGLDLIIDLSTSRTSAPLAFSAGLHSFEVIYLRTRTGKTPSLKVEFDGKLPVNVLHDQTTVLPIIKKITPGEGPSTGGARTKIEGYGLFLPLTATFGTKSVRINPVGSTPTTAIVFPPSSSSQMVNVRVKNRVGYTSNSLSYKYGNTCDPVAFDKTQLTGGPGVLKKIMAATSIALWQSDILYIGTRASKVHEVTYDLSTLRITKLCSSNELIDERFRTEEGKPSARTVLGLTFDPRDTEPRPYASVNSLFWDRVREITRSNPRRWSNGNIERLVKTSGSVQCLRWEKTIVENLPVSDGDHAVNEMVFTQDGDLLIAIGGFTNGGLPFEKLGGNWETYFAGAVAIAHLSLGDKFDGTIVYDTPLNLRTAKPISGDVELYATGFRNLFSMIMARDGTVYGVDMGTNCGFGNASSSCSQYVESEALLRDTAQFDLFFPGNTMVDPGSEFGPDCVYGGSRRDKLVIIKEGKFYGHANIQRALLTNKRGECVWIDPYTFRSPPPQLTKPPRNYEKHIAMFESPMLGVREYGSNLFCGRMRGDFVFSRYGPKETFRARKLAREKVDELVEILTDKGGLRTEENAHGYLFHPRIYGVGLNVLTPRVTRTGFFVVNALPMRHGRNGGKQLIVGGWGFTKDVKVFVGSQPCDVKEVTDREIRCIVPPFAAGSESVDVKVEQESSESALPAALLYMSV